MDLLFLLLLGATFIVIILYPILSVLKKEKKTRSMMLSIYGWVFVIVLIVGLVLWQLGSSPPMGSIVVTGFSKLKPLAPSVAYTGANGNFTVFFSNALDTHVKIINASVTDKLDESVVWSRPLINDVYPTTNPQIIASGDSFKLDASDNGAGRHEGDPFDLEITIQYTSVIGGIKTKHRETGRIRGPIER